jgi:hypothetical protein
MMDVIAADYALITSIVDKARPAMMIIFFYLSSISKISKL